MARKYDVELDGHDDPTTLEADAFEANENWVTFRKYDPLASSGMTNVGLFRADAVEKVTVHEG